ncbi:uracil-DNA glycosylase [Paenalkalicoccus suaedae]|uniref:Uracil-DNA glycosylase n=1 Tax=Paenalkalicoccus suaedae TaxID=2592382 RepID=A0A859F9Y3_9BACI|nr:uracil-DNA glycosylase [Paenalkalicoccus suaedae]QKS69959.1 uracil-DNA glycosylase [Paenalkalicoccus suaedae]
MQDREALAKEAKRRAASFDLEGFVFGEGPDKPAFMLIGEAPGETEIHEGKPFTGRAGKELMMFLKKIGVTREDVYITAAVRSRPFRVRDKKGRDGVWIKKRYNRTPTKREVLAHAALLDEELARVDAPFIVTLGNVGLARLLGPGYKITDCHGELLTGPVQRLNAARDGYEWTERSYRVLPTFHPASIFYNRKLEGRIAEDAEVIRELVKGVF